MRLLRFSIIVFIIFYACEKPSVRFSERQISEWRAAHDLHIQNIAREFKEEPWSPIPEAERTTFGQPEYYPYNAEFRFQGPVHLYPVQDSITISGSKAGDIRPALKYGWFEFGYQGRQYKLEIIKIFPRKTGGEAHLFLGFWDAGSGETTYAGGRYIDLEADSSGSYLIDFNYAYNPYCAYSDRYSCAIPPLGNRLPFAVLAGEKKYKNHP